jgi:CAAX protease family protein
MGSGRDHNREAKSGLTSGHPQPYTRSTGAAGELSLPRLFFARACRIDVGIVPQAGDNESMSRPAQATRVALLFEGALGAVALVIGWLIGYYPAIGMNGGRTAATEQLSAACWGLIATLPMFAMLLVIDHVPLGPLRRLRDDTHEMILQIFGGASVIQLALVAVAAGFGEELLFRGLLQSGIARLLGEPSGNWIAVGVASLVFGVCHWLNATYAAVGVLAGAYFGLLLLASGNLWTPITAHAAYDFFALLYLIRPNHWVRWSV